MSLRKHLTIAFAASTFVSSASIALPSVHRAVITQPSAHHQNEYSTYQAERAIQRSGSMINVNALRNALGSLQAHGLSASYYSAKLDAIESNDLLALDAFVSELIGDLRNGVTRSSNGVMEANYTEGEALASLEGCDNYAVCLQRLAARHPQYELVQIVLDQYRAISRFGGWPSLEAGKSLKLGVEDPRVALLRERLAISGDYSAQKAPNENANIYDHVLEVAVREFQARHQLQADGVVGPQTLRALNVPVEARIDQLELSLERLRRLPNVTDEPYVQVNIPSYQLTAYQGKRKALQMDVIVGKRSRPTPEFSNVVTTIGLNPTWTPTVRILRKDLLPKFRKDPDYAIRGGYRIHDRDSGEPLDPYAVNWETVSANDVRVVQRSGRSNALGKVKFLLPDNDSIYLHDTAKPHLFGEAMRALSSGCIRLSEPKAFLDFIIQAQSDASFASLRHDYESSSRKHVKLDRPIRVHTTYFTSWVNANGQVEFYRDIYRKDDRFQLALEQETRQLALR